MVIFQRQTAVCTTESLERGTVTAIGLKKPNGAIVGFYRPHNSLVAHHDKQHIIHQASG